MVLRAVPDLIRAQEKSAFSPVSPKGSPGDGSVSKRPCKHENLGPIPHPQVVWICNPSAREVESRLCLGSLPNQAGLISEELQLKNQPQLYRTTSNWGAPEGGEVASWKSTPMVCLVPNSQP